MYDMSDEHDKLFQKLINYMEKANDKQINVLKDEASAIKSDIRTDIAEIKSIIAEESKKRKDLEIKQKDLEKRVARIEQHIKKNNIVVFGLKHKGENLLNFTINKLNQLLEISLNNLHINNIFTIGNKEDSPILIQFATFLTKLDVLKQCKKLRGTGIRIAEDLNKEEREKRKILLKHQQLARQKNLNAYIKRNTLIINGVSYTTEELENLESELENQEEETKIDTEENNENTKANSAPATPVTVKHDNEADKGPTENINKVEKTSSKIIKKTKLPNHLSHEQEPTTKHNTRNAAGKRKLSTESPTIKTNTPKKIFSK